VGKDSTHLFVIGSVIHLGESSAGFDRLLATIGLPIFLDDWPRIGWPFFLAFFPFFFFFSSSSAFPLSALSMPLSLPEEPSNLNRGDSYVRS